MVLDNTSKHRLVGAGIMIVCAAIVLPMVLDGEKPAELDIVINIPEPPPLVVPVIQPVQALKDSQENISASDIKLISNNAQNKPDSGALKNVAEKSTSSSEKTTVSKLDVDEVARGGGESKAPAIKAAPIKKAESLKPAARWTVQIATFKNSANASRLVNKLKSAGYPAYRVTTQSLHKVFVGPEIKRNSSEKSRNDIEKEFLLKGIVVKFSPN
ncbi:SPOR domain-containing protein [Marinomonas balearica]|uniref:DedD protein n=1 Tax=Marinomonas balearica TaxID=491947 RepID=A0A4R6M834_9GAMM|nr:SPOR domain-containing protein [Marinomonas balearica]TDO96810.1 DedD protein [Marinomonas balearica]